MCVCVCESCVIICGIRKRLETYVQQTSELTCVNRLLLQFPYSHTRSLHAVLSSGIKTNFIRLVSFFRPRHILRNSQGDGAPLWPAQMSLYKPALRKEACLCCLIGHQGRRTRGGCRSESGEASLLSVRAAVTTESHGLFFMYYRSMVRRAGCEW